jgi:hypothetical protein
VKSYARALALWWQYLDAFGLRWDAVTVENFGVRRDKPAGGKG